MRTCPITLENVTSTRGVVAFYPRFSGSGHPSGLYVDFYSDWQTLNQLNEAPVIERSVGNRYNGAYLVLSLRKIKFEDAEALIRLSDLEGVIDNMTTCGHWKHCILGGFSTQLHTGTFDLLEGHVTDSTSALDFLNKQNTKKDDKCDDQFCEKIRTVFLIQMIVSIPPYMICALVEFMRSDDWSDVHGPRDQLAMAYCHDAFYSLVWGIILVTLSSQVSRVSSGSFFGRYSNEIQASSGLCFVMMILHYNVPVLDALYGGQSPSLHSILSLTQTDSRGSMRVDWGALPAITEPYFPHFTTGP